MADMLVFACPKDDDDQRVLEESSYCDRNTSSYSHYGSIYDADIDEEKDDREENRPFLFGADYEQKRDEDLSSFESEDCLSAKLRAGIKIENGKFPIVPRIVNYQSDDNEYDDYSDDVEYQRSRLFKCSPLNQTERTDDETSCTTEEDTLLLVSQINVDFCRERSIAAYFS